MLYNALKRNMVRIFLLILSAAVTAGVMLYVSASTTVLLSVQQIDAQRAEVTQQVNEGLQYALEEYRLAAAEAEELLAQAEVEASQQQSDGLNKIGVYLKPESTGDELFFLETLDRLTDAGGSALVFDVKGAYVYFDTSSSLASEYNLVRPFYELPVIISMAKQKGLYTIARLVAANDPVLGIREPAVRIRHPQTNVSVGTAWVDLSSPTVLEYNSQVIRDLVAAGVDEVNIDYIRYPTEYAQWRIGLTREEKVERIEKFVQMARRTIDEYGPQTKLGLSTYAILGWHYDINVKALGQDIVRFAPLVDVISPMAYPSTFKVGSYYNPSVHPRSRPYYLIYRTLQGYAEVLGEEHAHKLRPWIQAYYMTKQNLRDEMDAVFDAGACGFTFWSAGSHYDHVYEVLPEVEIPERCIE